MFSPQNLLIAAGLFLVFIFLGLVLRYALFDWSLPWSERRGLDFVPLVLRSLRGLVLIWAALAGITAVTRYLLLPVQVTDFLDSALGVILVVTLAVFTLRLVGQTLRLIGVRNEGFRPIAGISERIAQIAVVALGIVMLLSYLPGVNIAPLLTGLGVAGLATALALQDTLANFFAGLYVLADRPVREGDYARLNDSNVEGYIMRVGWRSTRLRTLANNIVVIPNQKLAQSVITNYALPQQDLSLAIPVRVALDSDPQKVLAALDEVANQAVGDVEGLLAEPPPAVRFNPGFGDYGLEFTVVCHVRQFADQYWVQHELRLRLLERLRREGLAIPYPTRTVHLANDQQPQ